MKEENTSENTETKEKVIEHKVEGLSHEELLELLKYVEENHSWKNMYDLHHKADKEKKSLGKIVKYMSFGMDTRDCDIWRVEFYNIIGGKEEKKEFRTEAGYNLKEAIYKWLKEERVK